MIVKKQDLVWDCTHTKKAVLIKTGFTCIKKGFFSAKKTKEKKSFSSNRLLTVFKSLYRRSIKFSFMSHPINHACFKSVTNSFHISPLAKNQMSRVFFRTKISEKKACTWNSKETYFVKNKYVPKDWFIKNLTNAVII